MQEIIDQLVVKYGFSEEESSGIIDMVANYIIINNLYNTTGLTENIKQQVPGSTAASTGNQQVGYLEMKR